MDFNKTSGVLDLPPLANDEGRVTESLFVYGPNGEARWITLDGKDFGGASCSNDDAANPYSIEMDEQNKLDDLRRFLIAKSDRSAAAAAQASTNNHGGSFAELLGSSSNKSEKPQPPSVITNNNNNNHNNATSSSGSSDQLWVTRYGATGFTELLSDERINLEVLQWLTAWRKKINTAVSSSSSTSAGTKSSKSSSAASETKSKTDQQSTLEKIILLTGPPGVGKTTLAHVVCRHCGFDAIEVNASYSRSAAEMKNLIESATSDVGGTGSGNSTSSTTTKSLLKPKCLILDEIDGSTSNVIKVLLATDIRRPVICLANNLYAPVLRELRARLVFVRQVPPLLPQRIVSRLEAIAEKEKIVVDRHSLMDLALHCAGDIRQCLNTLFFVSRQVASNTSSNSAGNASRLLRMLRVREPTVSIWTMWETALERKEKSKYITNLATAGVMSREDAASLSAGLALASSPSLLTSSDNNHNNNNDVQDQFNRSEDESDLMSSTKKIDIASVWISHCASKCPELDTVVNGLHEWFCQLGYADYNCRATASVCESFAWLDRADPFTGQQYQGITESAVINTFRNCATLTARPSNIRNTVPREAATWAVEEQRTKELIAEFLERPSPQLLGGIVKAWNTSNSASEDILPQLCRLLSKIPVGLKLAPGVRNLKDVRNLRDAEILRRLVELLTGFGVTFNHETSVNNVPKPNAPKFLPPQEFFANKNNQQEWKMTPDFEGWSKWKTVSSTFVASSPSGFYGNSNNNNNNKSSSFNNSSNNAASGSRNVMRDPAQGVVRAAAGVKARPPSVWERNMKAMPTEVRELLVAEIALQALQGHERQRRQRHEESTKMKSSAAALFGNKQPAKNDTAAHLGQLVEAGPNVPDNSADASKNNSDATKKSSTAPHTVAFKKDFFGRVVIPKTISSKKPEEDSTKVGATSNNSNNNHSENGASTSTSATPNKWLGSTPGGSKKLAKKNNSDENVPKLPSVKYRFFDGSSNSVRKGAVFTDFY